MDDSQKKVTKNSTTPSTPVIGTSVSSQDLSRLTRHLTHYKQQEIKELLKSAPTSKRNAWYVHEMASDVRMVQLENLIDDALSPLSEDNMIATEGFDEAEYDPIDIHYEVLMEDEDPPEEIKQFLTSLEKLVRRTQHQLKKYRKTNK